MEVKEENYLIGHSLKLSWLLAIGCPERFDFVNLEAFPRLDFGLLMKVSMSLEPSL